MSLFITNCQKLENQVCSSYSMTTQDTVAYKNSNLRISQGSTVNISLFQFCPNVDLLFWNYFSLTSRLYICFTEDLHTPLISWKKRGTIDSPVTWSFPVLCVRWLASVIFLSCLFCFCPGRWCELVAGSFTWRMSSRLSYLTRDLWT